MILSSLRGNVMMACRSSSNSELEVLAWAPRENVFQITVSEGPTDSCQDPDWSNIFEGSHGEITFEYSKCKSTWTRGTWTKTEEERNKFYSYTVYSYRNNFTVTEIILQLPKKFYSYW